MILKVCFIALIIDRWESANELKSPIKVLKLSVNKGKYFSPSKINNIIINKLKTLYIDHTINNITINKLKTLLITLFLIKYRVLEY